MMKKWIFAILSMFCLVAGIAFIFLHGDVDRSVDVEASQKLDQAELKNPVLSSEGNFSLALEGGRNNIESELLDIFSLSDRDERAARLKEYLSTLDAESVAALRGVFEKRFNDGQYLREWEMLAERWVDFDPEAAVLYAVSDFEQGESWGVKHLAAVKAALRWYDQDREVALDYLASLDSSEVSLNVIQAIGQKLASDDLDVAKQWVVVSEDPAMKSTAYSAVVQSVLRQGVLDQFNPELIQGFSEWLYDHAGDPSVGDAMYVWVKELTIADRSQGKAWIDWIVDLPPGESANKAAESLFYHAKGLELEEYGQWLIKFNNSPAIDYARFGYISSQAAEPSADVKKLLKDASMISDEELRTKAIDSVDFEQVF